MIISIPSDVADRERVKVENARIRRARYEAKIGRIRHDLNESREGGHRRDFHYRDYPFIGWDGEAPTDTGYSLFGSSEGHEICKPTLSTEDCFDLLLEAKREHQHSIFIWFGGRYDFDEITRASIPLYKLARLKRAGSLWWHGYRITEAEGKVYSVSRAGTTATIYEISGWFHSSYMAALREYGIGCELCEHGRSSCDDVLEGSPCSCACRLCRIQSGKNKRGGEEFLWSDIDEIRSYMQDELAFMPLLMDTIRAIVLAAGFDPRGWYGPSALARLLLNRNHVFDSMGDIPPEVNLAAQFAFAGGRFEPFRGGVLPRTYTRDKNSAYMHAALHLPNLARGKWRAGCAFEGGKFAVYHIRYRDRQPFSPTHPYPLFRRLPNGNVVWPRRVDGWYWSPEAELVANDPGAEFVESWVFDEDDKNDRPFRFVSELYAERLRLRELPDDDPAKAADWAIKTALAAIYGQLARTVGWDRKRRLPPKTHQLEWAGYILSHCRAEMWRVAVTCGENLVSIDTDSVTSLAPIDVPLGDKLGEWKAEDSDRMVFFQSGVYFSYANGEWSKGKTRGMERRRGAPEVTADLLMQAIQLKCKVKLTPRRRYVTTRMALNGQFSHHGQWREQKGNTLQFGGGGKRYHNDVLCAERCHGDIHIFSPKPTVGKISPFDCKSYPHLLPWKDGERAEKDTAFLDLLWVDTDRIDSDDRWLAELVA